MTAGCDWQKPDFNRAHAAAARRGVDRHLSKQWQVTLEVDGRQCRSSAYEPVWHTPVIRVGFVTSGGYGHYRSAQCWHGAGNTGDGWRRKGHRPDRPNIVGVERAAKVIAPVCLNDRGGQSDARREGFGGERRAKPPMPQVRVRKVRLPN